MKQIRWINVMVRSSLLLLLLLFAGAKLSAATYYVSNTGSDSANGSVATPWKTLNQSIPKLNAGDTLIVSGTFVENNGSGVGYSFSISGTASSPITLIGQNGIIDVQTGGDSGNYVFNGNYIVIDGLKITSSLSGGVYYGGAFGINGNYCTIKNCELHDMAGSLSGGGDKLYCIVNHGSYNTYSNLLIHGIQDGDLFRVWGHNNLITHCTITNCTNPNYSSGALHADLIQFWGPEQSYSNVFECSLFANSTISGGALSSDDPANHVADPNMNDWVYRNNVFANNSSQAIQCGADHMQFYNNTFYNWPRAIDFWAVYYANYVMENNVFINSGVIDSYGNPAAITLRSNAWDTASYNASSGDIRNDFATKTLVVTTPGFVNAGVDFHLLTNSILRNAGTSLTSLFTTDKDGNIRGATWDIGAFECGSPSTNPVISLSPTSLTFGSISTNTTGDLTLTVQNTGSGTLAGTATVSTPFSVVSGGSYSLGANQSQTVTVRFSPKVVGSVTNTVTFTGAGGKVASVSGTGVILPSGSSTTFLATSGTITTPFVVTSGLAGTSYISQSVATGVTNGGKAVYTFTITNAGSYVVQVLVNAGGSAANSCYANIDAQPQDPGMIWDIPVTAGFEQQLVSWRGNGTSDNAQFIPQIFNLTAGTHQLIVVGREANVQLQSFTISQMPPAPQNLHVISP